MVCKAETAYTDSSAHLYSSLRSARWAVGAGTYEQVVSAAIGLGDDTDTTACVAGGIAGLHLTRPDRPAPIVRDGTIGTCARTRLWGITRAHSARYYTYKNAPQKGAFCID